MIEFIGGPWDGMKKHLDLKGKKWHIFEVHHNLYSMYEFKNGKLYFVESKTYKQLMESYDDA